MPVHVQGPTAVAAVEKQHFHLTLYPHSEEQKKYITWARDIFAGTVAGINVTLVGHPLDTLKVRLQTQPTNPPVYQGLVDCFKKTYQWEGIGGFYKGVASPLAGQIFFRATKFFSFAQAKSQILHNKKEEHPRMSYADFYKAGAFAWTMGTIFECPIDLLKSQMQVQIIRQKTIAHYETPYNAESMFSCAKYIVQHNGLRGLYQGLAPHLLRNTFGGSIHLGTFHSLREWYAHSNGTTSDRVGASVNLAAGGLGGFLFWLIFFPVDVVKSSIQTDSLHKPDRRYTGVSDAVSKLYKEGGWKRFYKGFSPCLIRSVPANAVLLYSAAFVTETIKVEKISP